MISILIVDDSEPDMETASRRHPEVELLHARDGDEAVEKLARNRRIDAVLLRSGAPESNAATAHAILEENPAPPPLFSPAAGPARDVRAVPQGALSDQVEAVLRLIQGAGEELP